MDDKAIKLLIVDDNVDDVQQLVEILGQPSEFSVETHFADSGGKAIDTYSPGAFDCILLAHKLPDTTGLDVLSSIQNVHKMHAVPAVIMVEPVEITAAADALKLGAQDYLVKSRIQSGNLSSAIQSAIEKAGRINELHAQRDEFRASIIVDELTKVYNQSYILARLAEEIQRAKRYDQPLSLLIIDLDNFKTINVGHGTQSGDDILSSFALLLRDCSRSTDILGRLGGEEFAVVLTDTAIEMAQECAARICDKARGFAHSMESGERVPVTCSIGATAYSEEITYPEELIYKANDAMLRAKEQGRDRVSV